MIWSKCGKSVKRKYYIQRHIGPMPLFSIVRFLPVVLFPRKQTPNELRELVICELMFNFRKKKESKYCTKFLCCLQAFVKWCCFSLDLIQILVSFPRNPFFLHSIFTPLVAIFLIPDQFVISKRLNINCLREPCVFITAVVSICIIRNKISKSIGKFCHMFYILHVFSLESRIKMCKMYTAFQVFFVNVQCYSVECCIV